MMQCEEGTKLHYPHAYGQAVSMRVGAASVFSDQLSKCEGTSMAPSLDSAAISPHSSGSLL